MERKPHEKNICSPRKLDNGNVRPTVNKKKNMLEGRKNMEWKTCDIKGKRGLAGREIRKEKWLGGRKTLRKSEQTCAKFKGKVERKDGSNINPKNA